MNELEGRRSSWMLWRNLGALGESISLPFPAQRDHLGSGPVPGLQHQQRSIFSSRLWLLFLSSHLLSLSEPPDSF